MQDLFEILIAECKPATSCQGFYEISSIFLDYYLFFPIVLIIADAIVNNKKLIHTMNITEARKLQNIPVQKVPMPDIGRNHKPNRRLWTDQLNKLQKKNESFVCATAARGSISAAAKRMGFEVKTLAVDPFHVRVWKAERSPSKTAA